MMTSEITLSCAVNKDDKLNLSVHKYENGEYESVLYISSAFDRSADLLFGNEKLKQLRDFLNENVI